MEKSEWTVLGKKFREAWKEVNVDETEKEFMQCMRDIIWRVNMEREEGDDKVNESSYDYPLFLDDVQKAIKSFNTLYHVVSVTLAKDEDTQK